MEAPEEFGAAPDDGDVRLKTDHVAGIMEATGGIGAERAMAGSPLKVVLGAFSIDFRLHGFNLLLGKMVEPALP